MKTFNRHKAIPQFPESRLASVPRSYNSRKKGMLALENNVPKTM
jgi:hypothetical protein